MRILCISLEPVSMTVMGNGTGVTVNLKRALAHLNLCSNLDPYQLTALLVTEPSRCLKEGINFTSWKHIQDL